MALTKAQQAQQEQERAEARDRLRDLLASVDVIYTVLTHTSRDGMSRAIKPVISTHPDGVRDITHLVAAATGDKIHRNGGITMGGCGMDMGFALVYNIGRTVIGDQPWQCRGDRCPSNEHVNSPRVPYGPEVIHASDGGYRFRHTWL